MSSWRKIDSTFHTFSMASLCSKINKTLYSFTYRSSNIYIGFCYKSTGSIIKKFLLLRQKKAITGSEETIYQERHAGWGTDSPRTIHCLELCLHLLSGGRRCALKHIHTSINARSVTHTHTHTQFLICSDFYQYFISPLCLAFLQTVLPHWWTF